MKYDFPPATDLTVTTIWPEFMPKSKERNDGTGTGCGADFVGWAISKRIDTELCLTALQMALEKRRAHGCIHHSDRGVQSASARYVHLLRQHGLQISMSRKGNPYDNAFMESFYKTLKYEEVHLWNYESYEDVIERLPFFLEEVYNRKRLHSSIGYVPPAEFEAAVLNMKPADRPVLNL